MTPEEQKQFESQIESAVASLLTDDEICVALDIDTNTLMDNYHVVERARLKLKQKLNAKRILGANQLGKDVEQILGDIPHNEYRRKKPKLGTKKVEGVIVGRGDSQQVVDPNEVYKLARLGCSIEEMSDWFDVARETLKYNFRDLIAKAQSETKQSLRRAQLKSALGGNTAMLIWLGKAVLKQSESDIQTAENGPLPWVEQMADQAQPDNPNAPDTPNEPVVVMAAGQLKPAMKSNISVVTAVGELKPVKGDSGKPKPLGRLTLKDE